MFASNDDRLALRNSSDFGLDVVVRFAKDDRESELCADDIDHALTLQKQWIDAGAHYVEIFRVEADGSLAPTIGAYDPDAFRDQRNDA